MAVLKQLFHCGIIFVWSLCLILLLVGSGKAESSQQLEDIEEWRKSVQEFAKKQEKLRDSGSLGGWKGILFECSHDSFDDDILNQICQSLKTGIEHLGNLASISVSFQNDIDLGVTKEFLPINPRHLEVYVNLEGITSTEVMAIHGEVRAGKTLSLRSKELCGLMEPICDLRARRGWFEVWKRTEIGYGPPNSVLMVTFSNMMKDHLMELVSKVKKYQDFTKPGQEYLTK